MRKMGKWILGIIAAVLVILGAAGIWGCTRGLHHGLKIWNVTRQWLSAESSDQQLTITSEDLTLSAESFWMSSDGDRVYGLQMGGTQIFLRDWTLFLDNGRAYSLEEWTFTDEDLRQLMMAALLKGEFTAQGDSYNLRLEDANLNLTVVASGGALTELSVTTSAELEGQSIPLQIRIQPAQTQTHAIPEPVRQAMADPQPVPIMDPLEPLLPAVAELMTREAITGELTLKVECSILTWDETLSVELSKTDGRLYLSRGGFTVPVDIPSVEVSLSPAVLPLLLLRNGEFSKTADAAQYTVNLEPETARELCCALIPEVGQFDFQFSQCSAELLVREGKLESVSLCGGGEVPFLVTTIPITVTMDCVLN